MVHTSPGEAGVEGVKGDWDQKVVGMILEEMKRVIRKSKPVE